MHLQNIVAVPAQICVKVCTELNNLPQLFYNSKLTDLEAILAGAGQDEITHILHPAKKAKFQQFQNAIGVGVGSYRACQYSKISFFPKKKH